MKTNYYMDGYLKANFDAAKKAVRKDWDMVFIIDGAEGAGKSVLAQQCAHYCDDTFNIDRIAFTSKDFKEAIINAEKYQAIIYDEGFEGLNSRSAMSLVNKSIVGMMAEMRQKNLFVFIVLPSFFDLDKNPALWRSKALLHVYTEDNFERGYFGFFDQQKKKQLYVMGKKFYDYKAPKSNFIGKFGKGYVVDEIEYRKRKVDVLRTHADEMEGGRRDARWMYQRDALIRFMHKDGYTQRDIAEIIEVDQTNISRILLGK